MYVLADFQKNTCHTGILTDRNLLILCDLIVLDDVVKDATGDLAVLAGTTGLDSVLNIRWQDLICLDAETLDGVCDS